MFLSTGYYLGLPLPQSGNKTYQTYLSSPSVAKVSTSLCVTLAYSTVGVSPGANGFIGLYTRQAGTQGFSPLALSLWYNIPDTWNVEQATIKWVLPSL